MPARKTSRKVGGACFQTRVLTPRMSFSSISKREPGAVRIARASASDTAGHCFAWGADWDTAFATRYTSRAVDHDHIRVRLVREQAVDRGGAALERETLVDVALVGDLAGVDRGHIVEQQHARDAHRGAGLLGIPFGERLAHVLDHRRDRKSTRLNSS